MTRSSTLYLLLYPFSVFLPMTFAVSIRGDLAIAFGYVGRGLFVVCSLIISGIASAQTWKTRSIDLGETAQAIRVDEPRKKIYVSVPNANRVFFIDVATLHIDEKVYMGFHPAGLDLSIDGHTLYAALNQAGAIAQYDLDTNTGIQIDISITLGDSATWNVSEAYAGVVFASANSCDGDFAYITRVDIAHQTATRGAGNNIYRCDPIFASDRSRKRIYMAAGESFVVYALDASQPTAPVVISSLSGIGVQTAYGVHISPNGALLAFGDGNIVSTSTMGVITKLPLGPAVFSTDGSEIDVASGSSPVKFSRYSATTYALIESIPTACNPDNAGPDPIAIELLGAGMGWAAISGSWLCTLREIPDGVFLDGFDG